MSLFPCVTTGRPLPCAQLRRSLQCCSLLNYYQWVWRNTCSVFPRTISLLTVFSHYLPHAVHPDARPIFHLRRMWGTLCNKPKTSMLCMCHYGEGFDAFTWIFTLDGNCIGTQAQFHMQTCMNALLSRAHRCFSIAFISRSSSVFFSIFSIAINHDLQTRWL